MSGPIRARRPDRLSDPAAILQRPGRANTRRPQQGDEQMTGIEALKGRLTVGKPIVRHNLTIFPLMDATALAVADYLPFGLAQKAGHVRITEVSVSGSVPTLSVQTGGVAVLLLDGEELIGAKQNRIVNLTILAAAKTSEIGRAHV